jgi:hypothetical protein
MAKIAIMRLGNYATVDTPSHFLAASRATPSFLLDILEPDDHQLTPEPIKKRCS